MMLLKVVILTTALHIQSARARGEEDAYKALAKATYIQTGTDDMVSVLEKRYTPKVVKEYGGWIAGIAKVMNDRMISFKWTF